MSRFKQKPGGKPQPSTALPLETNTAILLLGYAGALLGEWAGASRRLTVDAAHDLRVASRRFRECLRLFREILGGGGYGKPLRMARKVTRLLGPLRNLDVECGILGEIVSAEAGLPAARAARRYRKHLLRRRKQIARVAARGLDVVEFDWLPKRMGKLLRGFRRPPPAPLSREAIGAVLSPRLEAVFLLKVRALKPSNVDAQHRLRLALKKCRYAFEVLQFTFGEEGPRTLKVIQSLQDRLGELHDLDVLLPNMETWVRSREKKAPLGSAAEDFEALKTFLQRKRLSLHARFAEEFRPVQGKRLLRKLLDDLQ